MSIVHKRLLMTGCGAPLQTQDTHGLLMLFRSVLEKRSCLRSDTKLCA